MLQKLMKSSTWWVYEVMVEPAQPFCNTVCRLEVVCREKVNKEDGGLKMNGCVWCGTVHMLLLLIVWCFDVRNGVDVGGHNGLRKHCIGIVGLWVMYR